MPNYNFAPYFLASLTSLPIAFGGTCVISTPGIALANFFGKEFMRAYSVFPHPNVFAGFLIIVWTLVLFLIKKNFFLKILLFFTISVSLIFSFSKTAIVLFVAINLAYLVREKLHMSKSKIFFKIVYLPAILAALSVILFIPFSEIDTRNYPKILEIELN